jgi:hypothetical protein
MENKTTIELIELLTKLVDKEGNLLDGWSEAYDELKNREPFHVILKNGVIPDDETLEGRLELLEEDIKKLKRHKHDEKTNDVLIRI